MGSATYMSAEQPAGRSVELQSNLFSLGVIVYEIAGGQIKARPKILSSDHLSLCDADVALLKLEGSFVIGSNSN